MPRRKKIEQDEKGFPEVITKARVSEEGAWEYLVKWAGYDSDEDSWEPADNVQRCDRLLTSFWKHVGTDDNDYLCGYEIAAQQGWIDKEKRYFRDTFVKSSKRKSDKVTRQERRNSKSSTSHMSESTASGSQSSDEEPPAETPPAKKLNRKTRIIDTEARSEPESDGHSGRQVKTVARPKVTTSSSKGVSKISTQIRQQELPLVPGSSTSIAPTKVIAVRTHQDQRTNPLVKAMSLPSQSVEAGSSLSTKQRIAAGIPPPPTVPKPLPSVPKKSLPPLSFKKNKPAVPVVSQMTTSSISVATAPMSPVIRTTNINDDATLAASPQSMDVDQPVDLWGSVLDETQPVGGSSDIPTAPIPPKSQEEIIAEEFLQTIHIPVFSGPLEMTTKSDESGQPTAELSKIAIPKIPKKWKWSGDLFISISESKTKLLCAVTIADSSATSNISHINLLLSYLDSLRISKLYPIMDLSPLLRACGKPQYFGTLESSEPSGEAIIHGLEYHLTSEGLAAAIPLLLDGSEVAVLVVFPGAQQGLTKVLQVPEHLLSGTPLIVVLLPFLAPAMTSTSVAGQRSIETVIQSISNQRDVTMPQELSHGALLYQAMSLLCFPKALLDFLNSSSTRTYCIWPSPDQIPPGLDTIMLQYILKSTKAVLVKSEEDVRVVFISNQHLKALHTMPTLVTKLVNSPEIQFWTYGYCANSICQSWRVQEIYPLGGVVTFTPFALAEDLVGCYQLISQIIEHPLWDCYFIPEVLAVSHLLCSNGHLGSSSESCLASILELVDLGLISVIRMPEEGHSNQVAWLSRVLNQSTASRHELLDVCLGVLRSHHTTLGMTTEQLIAFTNNEITKDLTSAQMQPAFMENYRRFMVIRASSEDSIPFDKDGLEWLPLSLFSFKDDYFQS